ncbi:cytochrome o ubiquinol oxidase subunit IV [Candidatus Kirkpatrickella diaphorinae]|uniref:Cytochrome bo(3) ubiquinol oxidase subunit 4 n=1 Tax=Candidatus Kirkpatrickella diaphorinae TaxID=2984322 RepID=A0ABY6GKP9_9PROT|nr:cytochrome o ubiquinol oxidase subunit IV [Candidatus Kirkpatrickella diaphorinae]UYH52115.1 cytochrome o ubiquinol oxidase subunit IV [Candidatus Kirkpatrickella diaphorinae]
MSNAHIHTAEGESHGTFASYIVGFILAAILTVAAFAAVMMHQLSPVATVAIIAALAAIQVFVHVVFFLHMNGSSSQTWNTVSFLFAIMCLIFFIGGTIFIMHDVAVNMMSR